MKLLIIEDSVSLRRSLRIGLENLGFTIDETGDGAEGLSMAMTGEYELIILDIMLPSIDGITLLQTIRAKQLDVRVLILSAKQEPEDRVKGLLIGADDYLTKPFSIRELVARVKALLRRREMFLTSQETEVEDKELNIGDLMINEGMRKVRIRGENIDLSPKEFDLLVLLASNPGKTYTRMHLLNKIWGYEFEGFEHTVNSHINRLRSKVEQNMHEPEYILTTWGVGYKFREL